MYRKDEPLKQSIYILRSKDKNITKIGRSYNVDTRVDAISILERTTYYLVYQSQKILKEDAIKLEKEVIEHFKEDCVKGKEWLSTHPLDVIKFIVSKIGKEDKKHIELDELAKHYCFLSTNAKYNSIRYEHLNGIKIDSEYYAYVKTLYHGQIITLGFSNIKDAYNYVSRNRHLQRVLPIIAELLFDMTYSEWVESNLSDYKKANWLLL